MDLAATVGAGRRKHALLESYETDGGIRPDRRPENLPEVRVQTGGNIDGEHRGSVRVDCGNRFGPFPRDISLQPRPKQGIYDEVRLLGQAIKGLDASACLFEGNRHRKGISVNALYVSELQNAYIETVHLRATGHDISVATIVANTAQHRNVACVRPILAQQTVGDAACPLHELCSGNPVVFDSRSIELAHLLGAKKGIG
jgi:hypothetical protein